MPEQLLLPDIDAKPEDPTDRLFFAIFPDAEAAERIKQLAQDLRRERGLQGRSIATNRLHVTLFSIGDFVGFPEPLVERTSQVASTVVWPPFEASFDRVESFPRKSADKPAVLLGGDGLAQLSAFQQELASAMAGLGFGGGRNYRPHLTLLYDDQAVVPQPVDPISWRVREFALVDSLIGKTRYRLLGRWPLRG